MSMFGDWAATVAGVAAGVAGLGYLARLVWRGAVKLDRINELVSRELTHNHGSSMKDDLHGIAVALVETQRQVDDLTGHVTRLTELSVKNHPDDWKELGR